MLAVYKKELRGYLTSMVGYVFIAFVLLILGIYFTAYNLQYASPDFGATLSSVTFFIFGYYTDFNDENIGGGKEKSNRSASFNSSYFCVEGYFR